MLDASHLRAETKYFDKRCIILIHDFGLYEKKTFRLKVVIIACSRRIITVRFFAVF